jgi:ankyrin repeat protein
MPLSIDFIRMNEGCTTLHMACAYGSVDIVTMLLDRGADIDAKTSYYNVKPPTNDMPALHIAAINNHAGVINVLLDRGVDVRVQDDDGRQALHHERPTTTRKTRFTTPQSRNARRHHGC